MKFYRLSEITTRSGDLAFKASAVGPLIGFILFCGIGIVLLLFGMSGEKIYGLNLPPAFLIYVGAPTFGLLGWIACGQLRTRLKPTNWLLRCDSSGVIIKYRSFENWRFPVEDVQVVGLDYAEIREIRTTREQRTAPGLGGNQTDQIEYLTYLDFCLADADTSALQAHLQAELTRQIYGSTLSEAVAFVEKLQSGG